MPFEKGCEPGPGRPKGSKSIKTLLRASEALAEIDRHPILELVKIADASEKPEFKRDLWMTIQSFCEVPLPPRTTPQTPEESVAAAQAAMNKLAELSRPLEPANPDPQS